MNEMRDSIVEIDLLLFSFSSSSFLLNDLFIRNSRRQFEINNETNTGIGGAF
jgi:hypothetical protein